MNLVIVESPTKARKLKSYLGDDFKVEASVGHIRDLPKSGLGIDLEKDFEPEYVINDDKAKVFTTLEKLAAKADSVYLATDPDREGEAIAWHIKFLLKDSKKTKLEEKDFRRATFHEITKPAVLEAIEKPTRIRLDLVDAQQARRVVDRLVGYKLSPVLWKKIRRGLSAGRVQSVALRLIVEREREIEAFKPDEYWEVDVALSLDKDLKKRQCFEENKAVENLPDQVFIARVTHLSGKKYSPESKEDVEPLEKILPAASYSVSSVEKTQRNRYSLPPFTTSTLQQKAATMLGMSSKQTMRLAQHLYEEGLITYHRTDSFNLSSSSVAMARDHIAQRFGEEYLPEKPRFFANKSKNAQEAHEAIRVTSVSIQKDDILKESKKFTRRHVQLYDLIWRRFVASQMETAVYDRTSVEVEFEASKAHQSSIKPVKYHKGKLSASGSILKFDGWTRLFPNSTDVILPDLENKAEVSFVDDNFAQKFTLPPARYNDASLVKTLEKMGIGRPSTYASIISVILDRGYVERQDKRFFATSIGTTVSDFLVEHFETIMDYDFTAEMEEDLDRIARGEKEWKKVVGAFYKPFEKKLETVTEKAERVAIPVEKTGEKCPECGKEEGGEVVIRTGRYGKFKSCSRFPDCKFTENIVNKVEGVKCPLCQKGDVISRNTRWGKSFYGCSTYPECDWASWSEPKKGDRISQKEWDMLQKKRAERKAKREATRAKKSGSKSKASSKSSKSKRKTKKKTKKT